MKVPTRSTKLLLSLILGLGGLGLIGLAASFRFSSLLSRPAKQTAPAQSNEKINSRPELTISATLPAEQSDTKRAASISSNAASNASTTLTPPNERNGQSSNEEALLETRAPHSGVNESAEAEGEKPGREDWFYEQRAYPLKAIPAGARFQAVEQLEALETRRRRLSAHETQAADPLIWTPLGPQPIGQGQTSGTPRVSVSGRISAVALHPQYNGTTNQTVYVGAAQGGVWRSTDNGANWTSLTDDQPSLAIGDIAIDPSNPNIIYVGTGEGNGAGDVYYGAGLLKSTDGGANWTLITGPVSAAPPNQPAFINASFTRLVIDPVVTSTIYACTRTGNTYGASGGSGAAPLGQRGLWKSTDSGQTWVNLDPTLSGGANSATDIIIDPLDHNRIYVGLLNLGIYRSTDGGATQPWEKLGGGLPASGYARVAFAYGPPISPSTNHTLYAAVAASGTSLGIYRSTDGGTTWTQTASTPTTGQATYNLALAVDPTDNSILYYGTQNNVYRSIDGGASWQNVGNGNGITGGLHADTHAIVVSPANRNTVFVGSDGGMWRTDNGPGQPIAWTTLNQTLNITQFQGVALHPTDPNLLIGGTQDNGTNRYNGTLSWFHSRGGDGGFALIDQSNPQVMYHTFFNRNNAGGQNAQIGPEISTNGGNSWQSRLCSGCSVQAGEFNPSDRVGFYAPMAQHIGFTGASGNVIYFGTHRLYRTADQGITWTGLGASTDGFGADLTRGSGRLSAITAHPVLGSGDPPSEIVWIGTSDGNVQFTINAGLLANATFTNITKAPLPNRFVTDIALDPANQQRAVVTYSGFNISTPSTPGHVFLTTDQGATWTNISGDLPDVPVTSVAIDPARAGTYYIGTDLGAFRTTNGGANWSRLGTGLPKVATFMVRLHEASGYLYAATHGRGIYRVAVARPTASAHAASFAITLTKETIASAFGTGLATSTAIASSVPLPNALAGTSVKVRDSAGVERLAPLFFVAPTQINYLIPPDTAPGTATVMITSGDEIVSIGTIQVGTVAPGLFTANSGGTGGAAAIAVHGKTDGSQTTELTSNPDGTTRPIDLGPEGEIVVLLLYGTGIRSRSSLSAVTASIGGVSFTLDPAKFEYAGPAPGFVGLDQVNVQVPRSLIGRGEVDLVLTVDGKTTNTVKINIK
jgi:uncharacterized protein (TIGR03437 family)